MSLAHNVEQLRVLVAKTPANDRASEEATLVMITKMMMVLPGQKTDELGAEALGEAYMMTLDDLPSWSVDEAIRRWYRKECGKHDYRWRPSPGDIRDAARAAMWRVQSRIFDLEALLAATPAPEFTDEYRQTMLTKLAGMLHGFVNREDPILRRIKQARESALAQLDQDKANALNALAEENVA